MFDPITLAIMGGTALAGGLANALSGDPDKITYEDLKREGYEEIDVSKITGNLLRYAEAMKKQALQRANASAKSKGYDEVAVNYSATEGIDTATIEKIGDVEAQAEAEKRAIQNKLALANAEIEANKEPLGSRILGGAIQGLGVGASVAGTVSKIGLDKAQADYFAGATDAVKKGVETAPDIIKTVQDVTGSFGAGLNLSNMIPNEEDKLSLSTIDKAKDEEFLSTVEKRKKGFSSLYGDALSFKTLTPQNFDLFNTSASQMLDNNSQYNSWQGQMNPLNGVNNGDADFLRLVDPFGLLGDSKWLKGYNTLKRSK